MKFTLGRNRIFASVMGHTIEFVKGEATHVPNECHAEVMAIGAIPEEDIPEQELQANERPRDPTAVERAVFAVFEKMVLRNDSTEFSAGGMPHPKSLEKHLGWKVDARERDDLWKKFQQVDKV